MTTIWFDKDRFAEIDEKAMAGPQGINLAMDIIMVLWAAGFQPVENDAQAISDRLNVHLPLRGYTPEIVAMYLPHAKAFLVETSSGLVPHPAIISVNDPGREVAQ